MGQLRYQDLQVRLYGEGLRRRARGIRLYGERLRQPQQHVGSLAVELGRAMPEKGG